MNVQPCDGKLFRRVSNCGLTVVMAESEATEATQENDQQTDQVSARDEATLQRLKANVKSV